MRAFVALLRRNPEITALTIRVQAKRSMLTQAVMLAIDAVVFCRRLWGWANLKLIHHRRPCA